ncbi:hypothetical protein [Winogradskyella sp. A3E31]|uniref:hypothetical protein n=1 Tax=Winogradskyella sp. A3E31 TaxID=3349637 RepID=UPI00398AF0EF
MGRWCSTLDISRLRRKLKQLVTAFLFAHCLPVMGVGIKIQARDVMGYLVVPFIILFVLEGLLVTYVPL